MAKENSPHGSGKDICKLLGLHDAQKRKICLIIWRLTANALRVNQDDLNPDMEPKDLKGCRSLFDGIDILGDIEHEVSLAFNVNISFDIETVPLFANRELFFTQRRFYTRINSGSLKDWIMKMTELTNSLVG